jgi:hypothetical protein
MLGVYRTGSLKTVASELAKYNFTLMAAQEVRWVEDGSLPADDYMFLYRNGNVNHHFGTGFFVHKGIISAIKRA